MNPLSNGGARRHRSNESLLLVANYAPDVGYAWWLMENFWRELAGIARQKGMMPIVAYPAPGPVPPSVEAANITTVTFPFPGSSLGSLLASLRFLVRYRVRCIYFTDRAFTSPKYALFRLCGVRRIINHDHTPGDRPAVGGLRGFVKAVWRRVPWINCDLQLCVSPLIKQRGIANARIPADRLQVIQNGIQPIECDGDAGYAHRELGIPIGARICITSGRASPYKRIDFVIEVAKRCLHQNKLKDLYFVYCGDGPELPKLKRLAANKKLGSQFIFAGVRGDIRRLLCSVDFALHSARGEAFSLAILEYMSAGLAVLVPDMPSVCQAVKDRETGIVFPDGDADAAARHLSILMAEPNDAAQLGQRAAVEVRRHYGLDMMNRRFRLLLASCI